MWVRASAPSCGRHRRLATCTHCRCTTLSAPLPLPRPQITSVLQNHSTPGQAAKPFSEPTKCPSCSSPLKFCQPVTAAAKGTLRCDNSVCPEQQLQRQVGVSNQLFDMQ
jgi:hypothetical protein